MIHTKGNPWGHIILRGGRSGPNFAAEMVRTATEALLSAGLSPRLMIDCSHANSEKDHRKQAFVWRDVVAQRVAGNPHVIGMMLESNLNEGSQKLTGKLSELKYGVSITDACLGWDETRELLLHAHEAMGKSDLVAAR